MRLSLLALLCLFPVLASAQRSRLEVVSTTPAGRSDAGNAKRRKHRPPVEGQISITATFNQPMVPLSSAKDMGAFCPIVVEPKTPGRCRWQGTQSLAFEPE